MKQTQQNIPELAHVRLMKLSGSMERNTFVNWTDLYSIHCFLAASLVI